LGDGGRVRGLVVEQVFVWGLALLLLLTDACPALALAHLLRDAYHGCRSLTQARVTAQGAEAERGLLLGAIETTIAVAQVVAPYAADWLCAGDLAWVFVASLAPVPVALLVGRVGSPALLNTGPDGHCRVQ
jgi:hypothetical protein